MKQHEIFPVPIWEFTYTEAETFREKIVPLFKEIEKNNANKKNYYTKDGYTSYDTINNIYTPFPFHQQSATSQGWRCENPLTFC